METNHVTDEYISTRARILQTQPGLTRVCQHKLTSHQSVFSNSLGVSGKVERELVLVNLYALEAAQESFECVRPVGSSLVPGKDPGAKNDNAARRNDQARSRGSRDPKALDLEFSVRVHTDRAGAYRKRAGVDALGEQSEV